MENRDALKQFILNGMPQQPRQQHSLKEQLRELIPFANKLGLYDAADFLTEVSDTSKEKENEG